MLGKKFEPSNVVARLTFPRFKVLGIDTGSPENGILVQVNQTFGMLKPQLTAALRFVRSHHKSLELLARDKTITQRVLILPYAPGEAAMTSEVFSSELLKELGQLKIDIELSVYPGSNDWIYEPRTRELKLAMNRYTKRFAQKRAAILRSRLEKK